MNLILVESPAKAKTIEKYLGKEFKVRATVGHIIDLPKSKLAVDVDNKYKPQFVVIEGKEEIIKKIKKELPKSKKVYLAMDPDREGEAIAYHAADALGLSSAQRIVFHEITKEAVTEAIGKPRSIDKKLVDAQFARRVLDRLVGYKLSELLWKKIWYGLSAGRVQSVALKLIVEREREIENFKPEEFWDIKAELEKDKSIKMTANLVQVNGKKADLKNAKEVEEIKQDIGRKDFKVVSVDEKNISRHPYPPYTTSTLQQAANRILGYSAKKTMSIAQSLYQAGHITYMRTDSTNLSSQAVGNIRGYIEKQYGKEYVPSSPNFYKTRSKNAQEAHEAIRPTHMDLDLEKAKKEISSANLRLYNLIWKRAVASQMSDKKAVLISAKISPISTDKEYTFSISAERILFDGFRKVLKGSEEGENVELIGKLSKGDILQLIELLLLQQYTKPKPRYSEASLVKELERLGIGRPSTYATIISTVVDRGYIEKKEKQLMPTEVGRVVSAFLEKNFARLLDYKYTANVEQDLDNIASGEVKYAPFIDSQYKPLIKEIKEADGKVKKEDVVILGKSKEKCEECGGKMVERLGKNGKFLSCAKFPECKGIKSLGGEEKFDDKKYVKEAKCDKCDGDLVLKVGKYGKFWACSKYPECKNTKPLLLKEKCPECKSNLVEKSGKWGRTFTGCSGYPKCRYIKKTKKAKK